MLDTTLQGESRVDGMTSELWRAARLVESALDAAVESCNVAALIVSNDMPSAALVAAASVCRRSVFFVLVPSVREAVRLIFKISVTYAVLGACGSSS